MNRPQPLTEPHAAAVAAADKPMLLRSISRAVLSIDALVLLVLWFSAEPTLDMEHKLMGILLGMLTLYPFYRWSKLEDKPVPFLELVALHFFLIMVPPVFLGPIEFIGAWLQTETSGENLTRLMVIVIIGIFSLYAGYRLADLKGRLSLPAFHIDWERSANFLLFYLLIASFSTLFEAQIPTTLKKLTHLIFFVNGSVAVYALSIAWHSNHLPNSKKLTAAGLILLFSTICLSTGWLSSFIYPLIALLIGEVQITHRIPWRKIALLILLIVVLSITKAAFREKYWQGSMGLRDRGGVADAVGRAQDWMRKSLQEVSNIKKGAHETATVRANHLAFMGHVVQMTPEVLPYYDGFTYRQIIPMLLPRFIWPDKPSTMDLTNEVALRYGWLSPLLVGRVAVSAGLMDEAYMNYGVGGVVLVMFLFGAFIRIMTDTFGDRHRGLGWQLLFVGFLFGGGLMVTWMASSYLAGLWQTLLVLGILYWPIRQKSGWIAEGIRSPAG
jgi:hypothetical protein